MKFTETARQGYSKLFAKMLIAPDRAPSAKRIAKVIVANKSRYEAVSAKTGVPWWWIGCVHSLEGGLNFRTHLHNGDTLTRRTYHIPAGRPKTGKPPFKWEDSAVDALMMHDLHLVTDWSLPHALYLAEAYNGWGYVLHGVNSAYVWSFSNLYTKGKYIADGKWSATAVSEQCGFAVILKTLINLGSVSFSASKEAVFMSDFESLLPLIRAAAPTVAGLIGGPFAGLAVAALSGELGTPVTATDVAIKLKATPTDQILAVLAKVEGAVKSQMPQAPQPQPVEPQPQPIDEQPQAVVAPVSPNGVLVDPQASVVKALVGAVLFVLCSIFVKDAAMAHTLTDALAPAVQALLTGIGGGALTWLLHRSVTISNANTITALK